MTKIFNLKDLDCPNCAAKMEQAISKIDAVDSANVSFLTQKMIIEADANQFDRIMEKVIKVCKRIEPDCKIIL